ncbi:VRR-NUC domain-containing protein [Burkholderia cenocepacia]|uniref:VRR-NUC domain-containing protein n=1 Tax=Burkholderia cenocepacia TaxID=95486 RepID=UPI00222E9A4E|nr:VRR-NUC domain-containing protein [Burkholderia cenocepacia]MCW3609142.1 VRR-NUC domain-containing protein [Burkholderia cenocepacia]MCW5189866.1 VRR-NUC domain-containing protein [Burkholderia cenocepacia]
MSKWSIGGTAPGDGETSRVYLNSKLRPKDQAKLCSLMCSCKSNPPKSVDGKDLRQICVASKLKQEDPDFKTSIYKPEVKYLMTVRPPTPIMSPRTPNKTHGWLPQWIEDNWVGKYERGVGNVRIPDVVIVKDPAKEPTQDNLDAVVEMKFKGDTYSTRHQSQDEFIAGPHASAVLLTPEDCGCPDDDGKKQEKASEFPVLGPAPRDATDGASKAAPWSPFDELEGATKRSRSVFGPRPPDGAAPAPSPSPIPLF